MKSVVIICALASLTLTGCQLPIQETEYDPLIRDTDGLVVNSDITSRTLSGDLERHWQQEIEPVIQSLCIQCHTESNQTLGYSQSSANNLYATLVSYQSHGDLSMMDTTHGQLSDTEQAAFAQFEQQAEAYWPWVDEIEQAINVTNDYFILNVESQIIQPACTLCHQVQEGQEPNLHLDLSFYPFDRENHGALNAEYALSYLLNLQKPNYLHDKATNVVQHGGGNAIPLNSTFSDALSIHGENVQAVFNLLEHPPF